MCQHFNEHLLILFLLHINQLHDLHQAGSHGLPGPQNDLFAEYFIDGLQAGLPERLAAVNEEDARHVEGPTVLDLIEIVSGVIHEG